MCRGAAYLETDPNITTQLTLVSVSIAFNSSDAFFCFSSNTMICLLMASSFDDDADTADAPADASRERSAMALSVKPICSVEMVQPSPPELSPADTSH